MVTGSPLDHLTLPQLMDRLNAIYKQDQFTADVVTALTFKPTPGTDDIRNHLETLAADWAEDADELTDVLNIVSELWYDWDMLPWHVLEYLQEGWEGEFSGETES